jgi:hypothetical protein
MSPARTSVLRSPFKKVMVSIAPCTGSPPRAYTCSLCRVKSDFFRNPT